ncbi:MAG: MFS transporter [Planctomycetota bacterium]|nr:MAG: MFS transporter [Planctomycetota bacterium]
MLRALGLRTPEQRAWALYDWANSAFYTTVVTAVFPVWFQRVVAAERSPEDASFAFRATTTGALLVAALCAPLLGALADFLGARKRFLAAATAVGILATLALAFAGRGDVGLALGAFGIASVAVTLAIVFYDSLLPSVARNDELDRVSAAGFALGYIGGGLLFAGNLALLAKPAWFGLDAASAVSVAFVSVALWWAIFALPLFRRVPEPVRALERDERPAGRAFATAFTRLGETVRTLRGYKHAFLMLLAFLLYSDGINTIIRFATSFGAAKGIGDGAMMRALLAVQLVGFPASLLFARLAARITPKRALFLALAVYGVVCVFASRMDSEFDFWVLAMLVALVQGGCQALSRSLFASMTPRHKSTEFFAFFSLSEKFGAVLGPLLLTLATSAGVPDALAILSLAVFFVLGGLVLARVDVAAGRRAAAEAERALVAAPTESTA